MCSIASTLIVAIALAASVCAQSGRTPEELAALQERLSGGDMSAGTELVAAGEAAVPYLKSVMNDADAGMAQFMAANLLGDIGREACVDPLLEGLKHPWFNVRRCAALALAKTGSPRARGPLEKLAASDPFVYVDPETKERSYLVREDAAKALRVLEEAVEVFLDDASEPPLLELKLPKENCKWPFPGRLAGQAPYNNYQQPTDRYVHAALDLLQDAGTPVRAVAAGTVAVIATNYPNWKTHHFFIVEPEPGSGEGWCYTHVDPDSYSFEVGDEVRAGNHLGNVVQFSLGGKPGICHLHLHYVAFEVQSDGRVEMHSLYDPLLRFAWKDKLAPTVHEPLRFVRAGTLDVIDEGEEPTVSGRVSVLAAISDAAYSGHISAWMTPVVTVEIRSDEVAPWRKLVLDQRGPMQDERQVKPLYLSHAERARFTVDLAPNPVAYVLDVTATDGDGVIEAGDARFCWDTTEYTASGAPRFPDGEYEVIVRTWDLAGNQGEARATVVVANGGV